MKYQLKHSGIISSLVLAFLLAFTITSCDLDVPAPSLIEDDALTDPLAVSALVSGAYGDFAFAMANASGGIYLAGALLTDELVHAGTWVGFRGMSDGAVADDYVEANTWWGQASRARWVAEDAHRRISKMVEEGMVEAGEVNDALAELSLIAGFANRALGDHFDFAVIDGGPAEDRSVFYSRAINHFDDAIQRAGANSIIGRAATGGKAHVYMMLGEWNNALTNAEQIPIDFVYEQIHSTNSAREENMFKWWAQDRNETTVWGTPFAEWGINTSDPDDEGDPRVQYGFAPDLPTGGDDRRPFYFQLKYNDYGANIPLVKGTEMRLIEAEYELINDNVPAMVEKINEVRTFYDLEEIDPVNITNVDEAWDLLMKERGIELWLEGRRLADLRRWKDTLTTIPLTVVRMRGPAGADTDPWVNVVETAQPGLYLMVSRHEKDSNRNL